MITFEKKKTTLGGAPHLQVQAFHYCVMNITSSSLTSDVCKYLQILSRICQRCHKWRLHGINSIGIDGVLLVLGDYSDCLRRENLSRCGMMSLQFFVQTTLLSNK